MTHLHKRPGRFTTTVSRLVVIGLSRCGISVLGSRVLEVRGRKSGRWRRTPVNLLIVGGDRYLVAPRGRTQWVRNLRASGQGRLLLGRRSEPFAATEITDAEKPPVLRAYIKRWRVVLGSFFEGVRPDAPEAELRRIAPNHPVFRLGPTHEG
jgi:deazaflavin-dependent oxidoreductase (nitroreductase family)